MFSVSTFFIPKCFNSDPSPSANINTAQSHLEYGTGLTLNPLRLDSIESLHEDAREKKKPGEKNLSVEGLHMLHYLPF